jgi:predicted acyltransferase
LFLLWGRSQKVLFAAAMLILVGYWALFAFYPLPAEGFDYEAVGVPKDWAYNFPGFQAHWNKNTNPATAFDQWFLNLFPRSEPYRFNGGGYQTLSFIPSLATMIFGLMAGQMLRGPTGPRGDRTLASVPRQSFPATREKFGLLLLAGLAGLVIGYLLHVGGICPVVKRIWTPSWTIYSTGWTCLMLAAFYGIIELGNIRTWSFPLVVVGANSIAIYCLDKLTYGWIVKRLKTHLGADIFTLWGQLDAAYAPLVQSLIVMAILWLILYWMYRRKIFLRI